MAARFAIKVYESRTLTPYSMPAEGVQPLGAYIKLRKFLRNYKRREKIGAKFRCFMPYLESRLWKMRKFFALEMLKIQPDFREIRGKMVQNVYIAGHTWTR